MIIQGERDFITGMRIVNISHSPFLPHNTSFHSSTTLPPVITSALTHIPREVDYSAPHHCNIVYEQKIQ